MTDQRIHTSFEIYRFDSPKTINVYPTCLITVGLFLICRKTFTDAPGALQGDVAIRHHFKWAIHCKEKSSEEQFDRTDKFSGMSWLVDFMSADIRLPGLGNIDSQTSTRNMNCLKRVLSWHSRDWDITRKGKTRNWVRSELPPQDLFKRGDIGNWQMGIARRLEWSNFYTVDASGSRGSGIGASGFGIQTVFE